MRFFHWLFGKPIVDPNEYDPMTADIHLLELDEVLRRLVHDGLVEDFVTDEDEDSTANFGTFDEGDF